MSDGTSPFFAPLAPGTLIGGEFEVLGTLGSGGMGVVYRAIQKSTSREVALKFVRPDRAQTDVAAERLRREIVALARVNHPNALSVIASGVEPDGSQYIAMEKVEGRSLQEVLSEERRLSPRVAVTVLVQIASALEAAHGKEVLHRDVKPDNIILQSQESGRIWSKLIDFGLAVMSDHSGLTSTGVVMGSPAYMPPERWAGERNADGRSDLYALGCVGYEMVTGRRPYRGDSAPSLLAAHCYTVPVDPEVERPELVEHRALTQILRRCLQISPDARFQTAASLVEELTTLESLYRAREAVGAQAVALPEVPPERFIPWSERDLATGELPLRSAIASPAAASTNPSSLEGMAMSDTVAVATDKSAAAPRPTKGSKPYVLALIMLGLVVVGWVAWPAKGPDHDLPPGSAHVSSSAPASAPSQPAQRAPASARVVSDAGTDVADPPTEQRRDVDVSTEVKPTRAVIRLVAIPADARLSVDGDPAVEGPRSVALSPGESVTARAQRSGYNTMSRKLSFDAFEDGKEGTVTFRLRRKKAPREDRSGAPPTPREDKVDPRLRFGGEGGRP